MAIKGLVTMNQQFLQASKYIILEIMGLADKLQEVWHAIWLEFWLCAVLVLKFVISVTDF